MLSQFDLGPANVGRERLPDEDEFVHSPAEASTVQGPVVDIQDMGDAEAMLRNKPRLREAARGMMKRGVIPQDEGWNGWLGKYQKALRETALALEQQ